MATIETGQSCRFITWVQYVEDGWKDGDVQRKQQTGNRVYIW